MRVLIVQKRELQIRKMLEQAPHKVVDPKAVFVLSRPPRAKWPPETTSALTHYVQYAKDVESPITT
jgi:hypothetical protein